MELVSEPAVLTAVREAGTRGRMLTFLTRGRGGVRVFARRRVRRGSAPSFHEPLQGGELAYLQPADAGAPGRGFSFVPQRVWPGVRGRFDRIVHALTFLESLNLCVTEGEPQPELFSLLVEFLNRLEAAESPEDLRAVATVRLLLHAGFAPQLGACVACRAPIPSGKAVAVDVELGGAVCGRCVAAARGGRDLPLLPAGAHGFVARALSMGEDRVWRLRAGRASAGESLAVLEAFVEARLGSRPRSHEFLAKMRIAERTSRTA